MYVRSLRCVAILMILVMFTNGCKNEDEKVLSGYVSSDEYFDSSFKDYTDYCKYYYNDSSDYDFINSKFYKSVTDEDINELNDFFDNFYAWVQYRENYKESYDFNPKLQVDTNDYFYIEVTDSNDIYGKYHNYDIYYYDTERHILYYFHNNS